MRPGSAGRSKLGISITALNGIRRRLCQRRDDAAGRLENSRIPGRERHRPGGRTRKPKPIPLPPRAADSRQFRTALPAVKKEELQRVEKKTRKFGKRRKGGNARYLLDIPNLNL